jgi:DNA-binding Xre family transcriptional regulator
MVGRHSTEADKKSLGHGHVNLDSEVAPLDVEILTAEPVAPRSQSSASAEISADAGYLAADVAHLYIQGKPHREIGGAVGLTDAEVHKILGELFADGMPKIMRVHQGDERIRGIREAYARGDGSVDKLVEAAARKPARSRAHAEQRLVTGLLMAKIDELRKPEAISIERVANAANVSMWTLQQLRRDLTDPRLSTVLRLCRALGVTAGELLNHLPLPIEPRHQPHLRDRAPSGGSTPAESTSLDAA